MSRISKIGKVNIIDNKYVIKEENNLFDLYNYLISRDFTYFPSLLERIDNSNKYEYIKDFSLSDEQKGEDIISLISELHNKSIYNKEVNLDKNKEIYNNLLGYVNYLDEYYLNLLESIELKVFYAPSELLFATNYTKLKELLEFLKKDINSWYNLVKDNNTVRVTLNHGNLKLDHLIKNNKKYLISWNNYNFDSPVNDLIKFYQNEWNNINFNNIFKIYFNKFKLNDDEKKLLFINICIPKRIEFGNSEYNNTIEVRELFDYIYKCESLIRPYYTIENKE